LRGVGVSVSWSGQLAATRGGTGLGSYSTGDLIYASGSETLGNLGIGSTGQVLTVNNGVPVWADSVDEYGSWTIRGDSGSDIDVTSGYVVDFEGGEGVDTLLEANKLTISGEDASTTNKGIASFNDDYFSVSSGAVSIDDIYLLNDVMVIPLPATTHSHQDTCK